LTQVPIPFAQLLLGGSVVSKPSPLGPAYRVEEVNDLPFTFATFSALSPGYQPQQWPGPISFNLTNRIAYLSLTPIPYKVYFLVSELFDNGTSIINYAGVINPDYVPGPNEIVSTSEATVGGETIRTDETKAAYAVQNVDATNITNVLTSYYFGIPPSSNTAFILRPTNLTVYAENFNTTIKQSGQYPVRIPDYTETDVRTVLFPLPYRLNAAFLIFRGTPYLSDGTTVSTFPANSGKVDFAVRTLGAPNQQNGYLTLDATGKARASIEFLFNFGTNLYDVDVNINAEFWDETKTGFIDPRNTANTLTNADQWRPVLFNFVFPTTSFFNNLFTVLPNGQYARKANGRLYQLFDYKLVYPEGSGPTKRRRNSA